MTTKGRLEKVIELEQRILAAIKARKTANFTGQAIATELGLCRQTIYKYIRMLKAKGHRIEGECARGFMAQIETDEMQPGE